MTAISYVHSSRIHNQIEEALEKIKIPQQRDAF